MGLKAAIEGLARSPGDKSDDEIRQTLMERVGKKNYVPSSARDDCRNAFLRQFCKSVGGATIVKDLFKTRAEAEQAIRQSTETKTPDLNR